MLILKLHPGQTIWIGKDIQVTMLGNLRGFMRIGIQTRQLQRIEVAKKEFWDQEQAHESE